MNLPPLDDIEVCVRVPLHEIEKLDELGLTFAASLMRIAHLDLQMHMSNVTEEEIDVLSLAASAIKLERRWCENEQQQDRAAG